MTEEQKEELNTARKMFIMFLRVIDIEYNDLKRMDKHIITYHMDKQDFELEQARLWSYRYLFMMEGLPSLS